LEIFNQLKLDPKKLFLIDALGALVSAFFLGVVLVRFNSLIGMPIETLYVLATLPCFFAVYSFYCYFFVKSNWRPFLKIVAVVNLMYCCLTISLMFFYSVKLELWGWAYFVVEILVIITLVSIELKVVFTDKASEI